MQHLTNANYSRRVIHGEYYPHIDGIRALAIVPVVLFHILAILCPGGFIGVDVFFVISGYLITGGILRDLAKNRFSIINFYHRRIRRILPAYFTLVGGVFAAGCILYWAGPLKFLGDAVAAGTLFLANFHFWFLGGDYFAPQLHSQALLHLWSLSVEEQFYLFIPILCAIIWRIRRGLVAPTLAMVGALSLFAAVYAVWTGKQSSAFYLLHFRAWELLVGSLLAMVPAVGAQAGVAFKHAFLASAALLMVLVPYIVISETTPFPGVTALPSIIGAALLIRYGKFGWVSCLLAWRPFVLTGKISYSLYLWHWPVIVFWKYVVFDQLIVWDYIGMILLSLLLAYLSWKFVELPVRTSTNWTMRRSFAFAAIGITILVTLGTTCTFYQGWPTRLHVTANELACDGPRAPFIEQRFRAIIRRLGVCIGQSWCSTRLPERYNALGASCGEDANVSIGLPGDEEVLLMGDSHASSLRYGLDIALRNSGHSGWAVNRSATPMFDLRTSECQTAIGELKAHPKIKKIILAQFWTAWQYSGQGTNLTIYDQLEKFALYIKDLNKTLFIATDNPVYEFGFSPGDIAAKMKIIEPRQMENKWNGIQSFEEYNKRQGLVNERLAKLCLKTGAILIPLHIGLQKDNAYPAFVDKGGKLFPIYRDYSHLSPYGSVLAAQYVLPYLFQDGELLGGNLH